MANRCTTTLIPSNTSGVSASGNPIMPQQQASIGVPSQRYLQVNNRNSQAMSQYKDNQDNINIPFNDQHRENRDGISNSDLSMGVNVGT